MAWRRWRWVNGKARSMNAEIAERSGKLPLTRAVDTVYHSYNCRRHGITRKVVRSLLESNWDGEWHHVGPYAHEINYFNTHLSFGQLRELLEAKKNRAIRTTAMKDSVGCANTVRSGCS